MAFNQPLLLILLPLVVYFALLGRPRGRYGRGRAWAALVLRCLIVALIVLSLAGMQSVHGSDQLAVVFLVDVSDSVAEAEQERALAFVAEALAEAGPDDRAALILFGADALVERPMMGGGELGQVASIPRTHQTDLEEAILLGMALFPAGVARRMVILSDGRPTLGQTGQAVQLAQAQGIQINVVPLLPPVEEETAEVWLADLSAPDRVHQGEEFTLSITARATRATATALTVLAGERVVAQEAVHLNPGANTFAIPVTAGDPGFTSFRAYLTPASDVYPQNNSLSAFTLVEGPPRVLLVVSSLEEEGEEVDAGGYLRSALQAAGLEVTEFTPGAMPSDPASLAEYAAVVLVDAPAHFFSPRALVALQSYVRDLGGGLVAVGGPHAYGVGGWYDTPLEETLPVEMTIHDPQRFPPMAIVVVIDKSGSMSVQEGGVQKIRLAGEAAARVAELIHELDEITVIAFDDRPADVIGPLPGSRRDEVIEQVIRLQAGGGGIYVRESLQEALRHLAASDRTVRHVILLADGADAEHQDGVPELIEEEMAAPENSITLSTVAIGAGQDLRFLEEIAELGGGRYHFTDRAANLPAIFAQETQLAMRSYVVEEPFYPRQTSVSPILTGIDAVPQLVGYVATTPKPAARVVLSTHQDDPLLAAWQYGLGRSVAWTSDATARWAQAWVGWDEFSRFWAQTVRWTVVERSDAPVEVSVALEGEQAHVAVDVVDESGTFVNGLEASVSLVGPDGEPTVVELAQTAPGRYEGRFTPQEEGAYVMRLTASSLEEGKAEFARTTGWVMGYSPEYAALEGDPAYLEYLAGLGGGRVLDEPAEAFAHTLRGEGATRDLWPYLLGLTAILLPFDVGVRRLALSRRDLEKAWAGVRERLPRRRIRPVAEAPSPLGRLFEAKSRVRTDERGAEAETPPAKRVEQAPSSPPERAPSRPSEPPPPARPAAKPVAPPPGGEDTLAGRLLRLRKKRERGEDD